MNESPLSCAFLEELPDTDRIFSPYYLGGFKLGEDSRSGVTSGMSVRLRGVRGKEDNELPPA